MENHLPARAPGTYSGFSSDSPWAAAEDTLVRTLPAKEVAQKTGRTLRAVYDRRRGLGMPDGRRKAGE